MSEPSVHALSPPRHRCTGCGGSCRGVRVRLFGDEAARIEALAPGLGIDQPVVDGVLRQADGECVFLDGDACRIHATYGAEAKPWICQQFPLVVVKVGEQLRAGIDPGCYSAAAAWPEGPDAEVEFRGAHEAELPAEWAAQEQALLRFLHQPGLDVLGVLAAICPGVDATRFASGVGARWLTRLQQPRLQELVRTPETGLSVRGHLLPVLQRLAALSEAPPAALPAGFDAWAIEAARRVVFLRLIPGLPPQAVVLVVVLGAVAIAWSGVTKPEPALSAWLRVLRAPAFLRTVVDSPQTLAWIAVG